MSTPSTLVTDRYRLVKMLGAGGMGIVWQAWDERLHRPVALKMLRTQPELTDRERELATERAMREARITAGLHHPHAVTVFDVVEHEGQPCIVMQLIESTPLSDLLREHGVLSPSETARIGVQVGSALAAAHKMRIVHRDVKPGNILITEDGSAMISDFGISHALGDTTITATGMIHGTPAYLAPEVARGLPTSFASDVFSLGSTMYAMLEGEPPFGSDKNAIALLHRVARGGYPPAKHAGPLAPMLRTMLSANPKRRPSMESAVESLSAIQDKTPTATTRAAAPVVLAWLREDLAADGVHDVATETVEEVATEPVEEVATEPVEEVATEPVEEDATEPVDEVATEPVDDVATEPLAGSPPTAVTIAADAPTRPALPVQDPTAETIRVDQPTRHEPPTAETEPFAPPASRQPATTEQTPLRAPEPNRRGRRAVVVVGILTLVGALVFGSILLFSPLRPEVDRAAEPGVSRTATATPPAETPTAAPAPSAAAPSSPPAEEAAPVPVPAPPTPEQRVVETLTGYYAMLPSDLDAAWPLMTADYQENHAGGRGGYEAFWAAIAGVEVTDVSAPAPDQAQATLTYYFRDGRVIQEVTAYWLVDEEGVLKIAATDVLSSTQL